MDNCSFLLVWKLSLKLCRLVTVNLRQKIEIISISLLLPLILTLIRLKLTENQLGTVTTCAGVVERMGFSFAAYEVVGWKMGISQLQVRLTERRIPIVGFQSRLFNSSSCMSASRIRKLCLKDVIALCCCLLKKSEMCFEVHFLGVLPCEVRKEKEGLLLLFFFFYHKRNGSRGEILLCIWLLLSYPWSSNATFGVCRRLGSPN